MTIQQFAKLGCLVGLYEAIAIVRWDWLMSDMRPGRVAVGLAWAIVIIAINTVLFSALAWLCRRSIVAVGVLYTGFVFAARHHAGDRWDSQSLQVIPAILIALFLAKRWPRTMGLLAIGLATPGLWGRVPVYTTALPDQLIFLIPGALLTLLIGAAVKVDGWGTKRPALAATAAALLAAGLFGGAQLASSSPTQASTEQPNLLFILVDTLRQDHVQPYGDGATTPGMARLAAEGARFDDAVTVIPKTTQSVAAFQTGKYPVNNGVRILKDHLGSEQTTLAETLSAQGYTTGAFVHNGWVMRSRGFEQGFDQFWSYFEIERAWGPARLSGWVTAIDTFTTQRIRKFDGNTNAAEATDRVVEWLQDVPQPFYGYVHYFDPHWPYRPPGVEAEGMVNNITKIKRISRGMMMFKNTLPQKENTLAMDLYSGEIAYNSDQIGRLLSTLDDMGIADNTIVVLTADHGHSLGEHDYWYHHGEFLYDPSTQIPLLLKAPDQIAPGTVIPGQVRSIDVMPTVLGLMGVESPPTDGVDALKQTPGPAFLETDISYFKANKRRYIKGVNGKLRAIRTDRYKLIYTPRKGAGMWEFFDLKNDPQELTNLLKTGEAPKAEAEALLKELREHIPKEERKALREIGNRFKKLPKSAKLQAAPIEPTEDATSDEQLSDTEREMLRALGYVE
jgi:arylsulfatase A-like enzyme